jgi:hypothetical protein
MERVARDFVNTKDMVVKLKTGKTPVLVSFLDM